MSRPANCGRGSQESPAQGRLSLHLEHKPGQKAKCLCSHGMEDILNSIDKESVYKTFPIKTWPKNSAAFYKSKAAYDAMPDIYDACIYEMWKKRCTSHFKNKYPTFELYREDFLRCKLQSDSG